MRVGFIMPYRPVRSRNSRYFLSFSLSRIARTLTCTLRRGPFDDERPSYAPALKNQLFFSPLSRSFHGLVCNSKSSRVAPLGNREFLCLDFIYANKVKFGDLIATDATRILSRRISPARG